MDKLIVTAIIGIVLIIIGILNIKGNISTLHIYHRKRVSQQDVKPFGRLVGTGTIICGIAIATMGVLSYFSQTACNHTLETVGMVLLCSGLAIGIGIMIFAMIKYNKGIF